MRAFVGRIWREEGVGRVSEANKNLGDEVK